MNLRLMNPRLWPVGSTAFVSTRPWYFADTAIRPPSGDSKTLTGPNFDRNATSSAKVVNDGGAGRSCGGGILSGTFCDEPHATDAIAIPNAAPAQSHRATVVVFGSVISRARIANPGAKPLSRVRGFARAGCITNVLNPVRAELYMPQLRSTLRRVRRDVGK